MLADTLGKENDAIPAPEDSGVVLLDSGEADDAKAHESIESQPQSEADSESDSSDSFDAPPDPVLHWVYLAISLAIIALSCVMQVRGEHQVVLPLIDQPLPDVCTFKRYLGIGCPGCGLTRSFISLADGNLGRAWHFNPVGVAVAALFCFQLPYRLIQLWRIKRGVPELRAQRVGSRVLLVLSIALFVQWIVRLASQGA